MVDPRHQIQDAQPHGLTAHDFDELHKSIHRNLLSEAKRRALGQPEMAVVFAQAAAELSTEWAITVLLSARRVRDLTEPILDLFEGKDLSNDRVRRIYSALSKDHPKQATFWRDFDTHRDRRHSIVHRGERCTTAETEHSRSAVASYIAHIEVVVEKTRASS